MRLLLDTHVAVWFVSGDPVLPPAARALIESDDNSAFTSVGSIWEIAIKSALRRGKPDEIPLDGHQAARDFVAANLVPVAITSAHAARVGDLPHHHGDPFDRLLVAQAQCEAMRLLTHDKALAAYGDHVLVV